MFGEKEWVWSAFGAYHVHIRGKEALLRDNEQAVVRSFV